MVDLTLCLISDIKNLKMVQDKFYTALQNLLETTDKI